MGAGLGGGLGARAGAGAGAGAGARAGGVTGARAGGGVGRGLAPTWMVVILDTRYILTTLKMALGTGRSAVTTRGMSG